MIILANPPHTRDVQYQTTSEGGRVCTLWLRGIVPFPCWRISSGKCQNSWISIAIKFPDGSIIYSTRTFNLDIPWLPNEMTEAHIVTGLQQSSLISTRELCEAGRNIVFDEWACRVYYQGELILSGGRDKQTQMWKLPINPVSKNNMIKGLDLHIPSHQL